MNALTLIPESEMQAIARLDGIVTQSQAALIEAEQKPMLRGILMARAMNMIRESLDGPILKDLMKLAGQPFGFKCDKSYPPEVIRDVATVALLDGCRVVGNEFNIISGQYYRTKEQLERRVKEWPGLSELRVELGLPAMSATGKQAMVAAWASWKVSGVRNQIACDKTSDAKDTRIGVRVNDGMGPDAILGKAKRKLYHRIWELLQGSSIEDVEDTLERDGEVVESTATTVEIVAEPIAEVATKPSSTNSPFQAYADAMEATDMETDARAVYDAHFGPTSKVTWTPEQDSIAINIRDSHIKSIKAKRGPKK